MMVVRDIVQPMRRESLSNLIQSSSNEILFSKGPGKIMENVDWAYP